MNQPRTNSSESTHTQAAGGPTVYERLSAEFPREKMKSREVQDGVKQKTIYYFETFYYIRRLNDALGMGNWRFEIIALLPLDKIKSDGGGRQDFAVHGRLHIRNGNEWISHDDIGSAADKGNAELGDAIKSAASDCLKRCARLLGVGLYLYSGECGNGNGGGQKNHGAPTTGAATQAQISRIEALAAKKAFDLPGYLEGTTLQSLSQKKAAALVQWLEGKK